MEIIRCKEGNCEKCDFSEETLDHIISELNMGNLVVYPTETLYGLGADPFDEETTVRHAAHHRRQ
jgi:L-threonylcarbamoyladenylate synthase